MRVFLGMGLPAPPQTNASREKLVPIVQYDRELSTGAVGSIWLGRMAQGLELGRLVSVRRVADSCLSVACREQIRSSSKLCLGIRHAALIKQLGTWEAGGELLSISEHLQGVLLYDLRRFLVEAQTPLPTAVTLRIIRDAARAALVARELASEKGAYQDQRLLFVDSIVVAAFGETLLRDTGVLTELCQSPKVLGIPGVIAGLSPEELSGPRARHESSEVFSLGVLLWELLANRTLFSRKTAEKATSSVISQPVPQLDRIERLGLPVPKELVILVCRAIDRDPRRRLASLKDLVDAIEQLPSHLVGSTDQVGNCIRRLAGGFLGEPSQSSSWSIRAKSDSIAIEVSTEPADGGLQHDWEPETVADRQLLHSAVVPIAGPGQPVKPVTIARFDAQVNVPGVAVQVQRTSLSRRGVQVALLALVLLLMTPLLLSWQSGTFSPRAAYRQVVEALVPHPWAERLFGRRRDPAPGILGAQTTMPRPLEAPTGDGSRPVESVPLPARVAGDGDVNSTDDSATHAVEPQPSVVSKRSRTVGSGGGNRAGRSRARKSAVEPSPESQGESKAAPPKPNELNPEQRWGI